MSNVEDGAGHRDGGEIIIVRRNRGEEGEHHSSAWKIAFADFMTAMMALFLVMWLTNSTSEATQEQIAQYFNPIKLSDPAAVQRGLHDSSLSGSREKNEDGGQSEVEGGSGGHPSHGDVEEGGERALFQDPYAVLAEIAAESTGGGDRADGGMPDSNGRPGLNGGEAYRDPFDPRSWQLEPNTQVAAKAENTLPAEFDTAVEPAAPVPSDPKTAPASAEKPASVPAEDETDPEKPDPEKPAEAQTDPQSKQVEALREALATELGGNVEDIDVEAGEGGTTISLMDSVAGGMFEIGSAKPRPDAVVMMEKVAKVLKETPGDVIIRGHTDSRPFRAGQGDNWQLSSSRAQMAFYMLTRGGLDEGRVDRIEGVADRDPKVADDPTAAQNRRIEILLKRPT